MKKTLCTLSIIFLLISCKEDKRIVETIVFRTDYKFSSVIEDEIAKDTVAWKHQISASNYATKGDYRNALIQWDLAMGSRNLSYTKKQIDSINSKYSKVPAVNYIIEQAKNNQVIIINEAHHNSFHRVFTKTLLKKLYDVGYTNLGLEALSNKGYADTLLIKRKYPNQNTGHYIKDPQFGDLVRTALEIGYNIFPYEQTSNSDGKFREIEQAKNIQKVIEKKPNEKFLIHCGFDHVLEGTHKSWEKAMAGRLTEFTGINPLTINQVLYSERSKPEYRHPRLKALNINESSVVIDKDNNPLKYERREAWTDIAVLHPITEYKNDRPNWLFKNGNKNVSINLDDIEIAFPVMILAYKSGEDLSTAIPIDITEIENRNKVCNLGLRKGLYNIVVTNGKESVKFEKSVE
jgi:hypothetical protein